MAESTTRTTWIYRSLRYLVALVFLWAGSVKLMDPEAFAVVIDAFGILPDGYSRIAAIVLPTLEIGAAVALLFDVKGSLETLAGLMAIFMAILVYGMALGLDVDCGCFGPEDPESRGFSGLRSAFYRDIGICLLMACTLVARYRCRRSTSMPDDRQRHGSAYAH